MTKKKENLLAFVPGEVKQAHVGRLMSSGSHCCLVLQCPDKIWRVFWYGVNNDYRVVWDAKKAAQDEARRRKARYDNVGD